MNSFWNWTNIYPYVNRGMEAVCSVSSSEGILTFTQWKEMKKDIITCGCEAFGNLASMEESAWQCMYHFIPCEEECLCHVR